MAADIADMHTYQCWLYLAVVIDFYSKLLDVWKLQVRMQKHLALDVLTIRLLSKKSKNEPIIHLVQASKFDSNEFSLWYKVHQ